MEAMTPDDLAAQLESLALLEEPARRRLYQYVAAQPGDVGRDEAARATRTARPLAAFHLDKLVEAGLLEVTFRRLGTKTGRGAGRPAKLYRRAARQFELSLPQRRYELAARILAGTLMAADPDTVRPLLFDIARRWGETLAAETPAPGRAGMARVLRALAACGYEPQTGPDQEVSLRNCPFDALRRDCRDVICGMNLPLVQGLLAGLKETEVEARLVPHTELCCVRLRPRPAPGEADAPSRPLRTGE